MNARVVHRTLQEDTKFKLRSTILALKIQAMKLLYILVKSQFH